MLRHGHGLFRDGVDEVAAAPAVARSPLPAQVTGGGGSGKK